MGGKIGGSECGCRSSIFEMTSGSTEEYTPSEVSKVAALEKAPSSRSPCRVLRKAVSCKRCALVVLGSEDWGRGVRCDVGLGNCSHNSHPRSSNMDLHLSWMVFARD